ncbi:hypothetical protein BaRGS_00006035 [Batillaria attramentaria]|uniref:Uncharacterized protein n=1 Tax=Batillaria attramentaria TaxID=370345 RepID=A0ABD0LTU7_9CAEN
MVSIHVQDMVKKLVLNACHLKLQHMMQELKELEATSSRAGGLPVGDLSPDDIARIIEEEQKQDKQAKAGETDSSPSSSPEPQQEAGASSDTLQPPPTQPRPHSVPQSKSDVFITET